MTAELHCHTLFSVDGRGTPEALVEVAVERGITALAVTEHNHLGSLKRVREAAERKGIRWLAGVEIDAHWQDRGVHLLAFGFDPANPSLNVILDANQLRYGRQYELFMELLAEQYAPLSNEQILRALPKRYPTHPSPVPNLWFVRGLVQQMGIDEFPIGEIQQKIRDAKGPDAFGPVPTLAQVRDAVRGAGGALLLAHVAEYARGDVERQLALIDAGLADGLDGFELHHPKNRREAHFEQLVKKAEQTGCAISGGSDCHDASSEGANPLGCMAVDVKVLEAIDRIVSQRQAARASRG